MTRRFLALAGRLEWSKLQFVRALLAPAVSFGAGDDRIRELRLVCVHSDFLTKWFPLSLCVDISSTP